MEIKNYNVRELTLNENQTINGGWLGTVLAVIGAVIYLYNNKDDIVEGFKEGVAEAKANHTVL
jgi:hypothetical protein